MVRQNELMVRQKFHLVLKFHYHFWYVFFEDYDSRGRRMRKKGRGTEMQTETSMMETARKEMCEGRIGRSRTTVQTTVCNTVKTIFLQPAVVIGTETTLGPCNVIYK